jgi:hypothetical protein
LVKLVAMITSRTTPSPAARQQAVEVQFAGPMPSSGDTRPIST